MSSLRVLFAGTPEFAVPALEGLLRAGHRVLGVYTQPDRAAGRGRHLKASPVKGCALRHGLAVEQPATLRDAAAIDKLASYGADVMIVAAYGLILPPAVLAIPRYGCINIHASLLPRWRGAAPIQRAILAGDERTGVTIMQMDEGLDTGAMLLTRETVIGTHETAAELHDRLASMGSEALLSALRLLDQGKLESRPQPVEGVSYATKLSKNEALIDWSCSAVQLDRQVRAFNPWPVAETRWRGEQLRVWEATPVVVPTASAPGTVLMASATGIVVATGNGALSLQRLQLPNRRAVSAAEFMTAHDLQGEQLGIPA